MQSVSVNIKHEAHILVDLLAENASWDDLMREVYVRQTIESGLADSEAGRVTSVYDLREKYGLNPSECLRTVCVSGRADCVNPSIDLNIKGGISI